MPNPTARHNAIIDQLSGAKLTIGTLAKTETSPLLRQIYAECESALANARAYINERMIEAERDVAALREREAK